MPPLREREEDVILLAQAFAAETGRRFGLEPPSLPEETCAVLRAYPWPGNVRELKHLMERAVLLHPGEALTPAALGLGHPGAPERALAGPTLDLTSHERALVEEALRRSAGNVSAAARLLGLSRGALRNRLERHGLQASDWLP